MKKTIFLALILFFGMAAFAGPKYDAIYHLISKSYSLNTDGSMDYHFRKELQLFSKSAFDTYGETFIWYNPEYQTLTINEAYTIRKDGSKVQTPANAFNPSLPYACENCQRFNGIREMVVTHTALEYDATIVLDYTIHTKQPFMQELMERVDLYENEPVEQYKVTVTIPEGRHLYAILNARGGQKEESKIDGGSGKSWVFFNLQPANGEAYLPEDYLPYVQFTTLGSPSEFLMRMSSQNALMSRERPFSTAVKELVDASKPAMEQVLAIRDYVRTNIRENKVPMRYMNYLVASPAAVWNTNCGNSFEKNLLLQSMLQEAGFRAVIGVCYNSLLTDPESAVRVMVDGKACYVSAVDVGKVALDARKAGDKFIAFTDEVADWSVQPIKIVMEADFAVSADGGGYKSDRTVRSSEVNSPRARTYLVSGTAVSARAEKLSNGYGQVRISDGPYGCNLRAASISPNRTHPVAVTPTDESYSYTVALPARARWVTKDFAFKKSYDFGYVIIEHKQVGGKMMITRHLKINHPVISDKKQIKQLREMLAEWNVDRNFIFSDK